MEVGIWTAPSFPDAVRAVIKQASPSLGFSISYYVFSNRARFPASCPQEYGREGSSLPPPARETTGAKCLLEQFRMATFNRIFTTERLLQIILVLAATFIMKLFS
jgi:hypothetical protein